VQRFKAPNLVVAVGMLGWAAAIGLLLFSPWPLAMVILAGLIGGIPAAVLVSTPAEILRPASRGPGNGVFYTIFYLGMAVYPPVAGRLLDLTGAAEAPILLAALTMLACLGMLGVFRAAQRRYLLVLT
jgi:predicted MFS family arabinose efflux permease